MKLPKGWPEKIDDFRSWDDTLCYHEYDLEEHRTGAILECEKSLEGYVLVPKEKLSEEAIKKIILDSTGCMGISIRSTINLAKTIIQSLTEDKE